MGNINHPKKLEIDVSSKPIKIYEGWNQCKVTCGEGIQTRKIMNSRKCNATQFRSCWIGRCSQDETATLDFISEVVSNQCLNLLQNANQNFHAKRTLVDDFCLMGLESAFWLEWEDRIAFDRKSQVRNNGCIPNATEKCKAAALEFFSTLPETIHDENLKECWNQTNFRRGSRDYHRENDFLLLFLKMIVFD